MTLPSLARLAAFAAIAAFAAAADASPRKAPDNALVEKGRAVYNFRCYFCHGYSGDARTLASSFVEPKPRDFQSTPAEALPLARIEQAVRDGVPGTAMKSFRGTLSEAEIAAVAAFVRVEFLERRASNTHYHTEANGWPRHERYRDAFPFARGEIGLDRPVEALSASERRGRRLFLGTCVTCHDRGRPSAAGPAWERAR